MRQRYQFFIEHLIAAGIDRAIAEQDACLIEHVISGASFEKQKEKASLTESKMWLHGTKPWATFQLCTFSFVDEMINFAYN